jgi:dienelactone hydrolase
VVIRTNDTEAARNRRGAGPWIATVTAVGWRSLGLGLILWALAAAPASAADDCLAPHSWVAGATSFCRGALVYGDYVDDDYGADTGSHTTSHTATLSPTAGDQSYPAGDEATADLIRLTLRIEGDTLHVTGLYNALYKPDSTTLAVAIDSDGNKLTGGGKWGPLDVTSAGWDQMKLFDSGDPGSNTIDGTMPLPPGDHWRVQAVSAIRSSGQVMNVAFRGTDEDPGFRGNDATTVADPSKGSWFEDKQAAALKTGDVSGFGADVDVADLKSGATKPAPAMTGLHERVYESKYTIPPLNEGRDETGVPGRGNGGQPAAIGYEQTFQYLGRYQPYGIYIPDKPGPHGMQMLFHGSGSVLSGLVNQPGMQARFGDELNRILVVPEARGQNGFGSDISERDLLDAMDDVEKTYEIDRDKVFSGGYSQGGYITYRMAMLYPDRFAGAVDWVGFTGDDENGTPLQGQGYSAGAVGNVIDFVGNLRRVPTFMLYSGADELVHVNTALAMQSAFQASDDIFTFYLHPAAEHLTFAGLDDWRKEAADTKGLTLVHDPPRVTYRTATFLDDPAHGIVHDRAYWVSEIREREKRYEDVDLTTHACGGTVPVAEVGSGQGTDPVPWSSQFRKQVRLEALPQRDVLEGTLSNVASLKIDARRACLRGKAVSYRITTDGPASVTFGDGRSLAFAGAGEHRGVLAPPTRGKCSRKRSVRFELHHARGARVVRVEAYVNGKRRLVRRGRNIKSIVLRKLPTKRFVVRIVSTHSTGSQLVSTRTFKGCKKTRPKTHRRGHRRRR